MRKSGETRRQSVEAPVPTAWPAAATCRGWGKGSGGRRSCGGQRSVPGVTERRLDVRHDHVDGQEEQSR